MAKLDIKNMNNETVGSIELTEAFADFPFHQTLIHQAVVAFQANQRQGNACTKSRGQVRGAGAKLWKQKGTGRARMGSIRSPLWRSGGVAHGPKPKDWSQKLNRKMKRTAMISVLAERCRRGEVTIIDSMAMTDHKTKALVNSLNALEASRALLVDTDPEKNLLLACRNIPKVAATRLDEMNVYQVATARRLLLSQSALTAFMEGVEQ